MTQSYRICALGTDGAYCEIGTVQDHQCDAVTRDYLAKRADDPSDAIVILYRWLAGAPNPIPIPITVTPPVPAQTMYVLLYQCAESYVMALRAGERWLDDRIDDLVASARQTGDTSMLDALRRHYAHIVDRAEREYDNPPLPPAYNIDELRGKAIYLIRYGNDIVRYNARVGAYSREQLLHEYDKAHR